MNRLYLLLLFCLFLNQALGDPNSPSLQQTPQQLRNTIQYDTQVLSNGLGSLYNSQSNFGNSLQNRQSNRAQSLMMQIELEKSRWDAQRQAVDLQLAKASGEKKLELFMAQADSDIKRAEAELEVYKTLFQEARLTRTLKVQKAIVEAELLLESVKVKRDLLAQFKKDAVVNKKAAAMYRSLEYCMYRPLSKNYLVLGKAIDALSLVAKNSQVYGPYCSKQEGHHLTPDEYNELKYQLAIESPLKEKMGNYFSPLLQIDPEIFQSLRAISNETVKAQIQNELDQLNSNIEMYYKKPPEEWVKRQSILKTVQLNIRNIISISSAIKFTADQTDSIPAANEIAEIASQFNEEIIALLSVDQKTCSDLKGEYGINGSPQWLKHRKLLLPCLILFQTQVLHLSNFYKLAQTPRLKLCPSRDLLLDYIQRGEVYSMNNRCLSTDTETEQIFHPAYNTLCRVYHQLEGCALNDDLPFKAKPNEENIFDNYAETQEQYHSLLKELSETPQPKEKILFRDDEDKQSTSP